MNHVSEGCTVVFQTFKTFQSTSMGVGILTTAFILNPEYRKMPSRCIDFILWHAGLVHSNIGFHNCIWWLQIYSSGIIWTISSANWSLEFGGLPVYKWTGNHNIGLWKLKKYNWGTQSQTVFKICEGMWCSSFYVKDFDVIVNKNYFLT